MQFFIVTFRETLEAAIIIGLIFSMLRVFGVQKKKKRYITVGIIVGIVMSFLFALGFQQLFWGFEWKVEKLYEGILMFLACGLITQFLVWTNTNFKDIGTKLKKSVEKIVSSGQLWMLSFLAFASVVREGVETVIFFNALGFSLLSNDTWYAIIGVFAAIGVSYILFFTIKQVDISRVLRYTNVLFILVAWGLLAHGIVELQGAGVIPTVIKPVFDLSGILSETEWIGAILKASLSYDANPSLIAFVAYVLYVSGFLYHFFLKKRI